MNVDQLRLVLKHFNFKLVRTETLPAGDGVLTEEVGEPGPWYGVDFGEGEVVGWGREPVTLEGIVSERVDWQAFALKLLAAFEAT